MTEYVIKTKQYNKIMTRCYVFVIWFCLVSCDKIPEIEGFDPSVWKADFSGCKGERAKLSPILESKRKALKGVGEHELLEMLGKPNSVQLLERQQRYFIYWIQNPAECLDSTQSYREVRIRLSALNKVSEVLF